MKNYCPTCYEFTEFTFEPGDPRLKKSEDGFGMHYDGFGEGSLGHLPEMPVQSQLPADPATGRANHPIPRSMWWWRQCQRQ